MIITAPRHTTAKKQTGGKRTIITWNGARIIRPHALGPVIESILRTSRGLQVVKIGIIGEPSSGKGSLAETLAHMIHVRSRETGYVTWKFKQFGEKEFLHLEATLKGLPPANYIIHFYDLSFLEESKLIGAVKKAATRIRHLREGHDVRIILIMDYHYSKGFDKYLRQANYRFFLSQGSEEEENMLGVMGHARKNKKLIADFTRKWWEESQKGTCTFVLGKKGTFTYQYKNPFVVGLFWNGVKGRYIVFPLRTWLAPACTVCSEGLSAGLGTHMDAAAFIEEGKKRFGPYGFKTAWKVEDSKIGIESWQQKVVDAQYWIAGMLNNNVLNRDKVRELMRLEPKAIKAGNNLLSVKTAPIPHAKNDSSGISGDPTADTGRAGQSNRV